MKNLILIFLLYFCPHYAVRPQTDAGLNDLRASELQRYAKHFRASRAISASSKNVDVHYYKLNIRIADEPRFIRGDVTSIVRVIDSNISAVTFDLVSALLVDSAIVNGVRSPVTSAPQNITITLPSAFHTGDIVTIQIFYHGNPSFSGLGSYTDSTDLEGNRWVFTLSQPYGSRDWWPSIDHQSDKADSIDIWITCDQHLIGVTSGKLVETIQNSDNTKTYRWKHRYPIATYLVAVTIGKFTSYSDWYKHSPADSLEIVNYVLSTIGMTAPNYRTNSARTKQMLEIYSPIFGPYPFLKEKYGHVEYGWGGGMEHQTLSSIGSYTFSEPVIAHELVHQWFGNMITCRSWSDLWLNEGFAEYFEAVYRERMYGQPAYWQRITSYYAQSKSTTGTLHISDTSDAEHVFNDGRVYYKGAAVLHMLRHVLGDSIFFASINAYATDPTLKYGTASTADFQHWCELVSGRDLDWFFAEWIYGERYPKYTYSASFDSADNGFSATVRITQTTGTTNPSFYTMPIDLKFSAGEWDTTVIIFNNSAEQTFHIPLPRKASFAAFDPHGWILRDLTHLPASVQRTDPPQSFQLQQNYPNPFNPVTTIRFSIPMRSHVTLKVFSILGSEVKRLAEGIHDPGMHDVYFDASSLASGVYYYSLTSGTYSQIRKMVVVK
jgi:aminopeptidase N